MKRHIEIAKHISANIELDNKEYLLEHNYFRIFEKIYTIDKIEMVDINTLICTVIYSYSNSSKWIDLKHDSHSINKAILEGLRADIKKEIYQSFLMCESEEILDSIGAFLDTMKSDWKFITVRKMIDFHSKTMMQSEPDLSSTDEEKKPKVRENISRTMKLAVEQRHAADMLIAELETAYVTTNHRVQQDFGVDFVKEDANIDIMSFRDFIKHTVIPLREQKALN